ncbi:MAG: hypothetical protein V1494_05370 [Candidatus Diapherotrites archaeon]
MPKKIQDAFDSAIAKLKTKTYEKGIEYNPQGHPRKIAHFESQEKKAKRKK